MNIIDISWPISQATTGYKDKKIIAFDTVKHFEQDEVRETSFCLSSHTGTHIDAPSHFLRDGKTIDEINLDRINGPCKVLDLTAVVERITDEWLQQHSIEKDDIILCKTTNSETNPTDKFSSHFVYLADSGARYLADKKIKAVGIDYLGIEHSQPGHPTHRTLMHNDVIVIEGLRLGHVKPGSYFLLCLPLAVVGLEAAPARAALMQNIK